MTDLQAAKTKSLVLSEITWLYALLGALAPILPPILPKPATRLKTDRLFQVDIDRREQCCAANYEQVVNHVVPSCYS